jgi:serine/threonine protein kinase
MTSIVFRETPTDKWLNELVLQAGSTKGLIFVGKYMQKKDVVVKVTVGEKDPEYVVLGLIEGKMKTRLTNVPVVYGTMSCYEKTKNINDNFQRIKGRGICYGDAKDSHKVYLSVISYIDKATTITDMKGQRLLDEQVISLIMQGLYTIYQLYYVFGILHNDFNTSNILIQATDKSKLAYKIKCTPYRFLPHELKDDSVFDGPCNMEIESKGARLYLIDYDQASIYHHKYENIIFKEDAKTCVESATDFVENMLLLGSRALYDKYQTMKAAHHQRLVDYCLQHNKMYLSRKDPFMNEHFLIHTSHALRVYIDYVRKAFDLPLTYKLY